MLWQFAFNYPGQRGGIQVHRRTLLNEIHPDHKSLAGSFPNNCSLYAGEWTAADFHGHARLESALGSEGGAGGDQVVDVPGDDYRAIRRAILDIDEFEKSRKSPAKAEATPA